MEFSPDIGLLVWTLLTFGVLLLLLAKFAFKPLKRPLLDAVSQRVDLGYEPVGLTILFPGILALRTV